MRELLPKSIADRCEFEIRDQIVSIRKIKPTEPCPCGAELDSTRVVKIARNTEPTPHYRESCGTCKRVSILGHNDWHTAMELNRLMRCAEFAKNNPDLYTKTK
jgi:hypothetical protein